MKPNTALAFILCSISLLLQQFSRHHHLIYKYLGKFLGVVISLFGIMIMIEYIFGYDLHIDQLFLIETPGSSVIFSPGRPAPVSGLNFILIGIALVLSDIKLTLYFNQLLCMIIGLIGLLILTSLSFHFYSSSEIVTYTYASIHTSVCFILISLSLLFHTPSSGIMLLLSSKTSGGIVARRLLPIIIALPFLLGCLRILGDNYNLYDIHTVIALYSIFTTAILVFVIFTISYMLMKSDNKHLTADEQLRKSNSEFENLNKALRVSEARFHNAMDTAPIGMAIVSLDGKYVEVNKALCQLLGYKKEELEKMTFRQITYPEDLAIDLVNAQSLIDGKIRLHQIEKRYIRKNGELIWVQLTASILRDSVTDKPLYFITQVEDITERKQIQDKIHQLAYYDSLTNLPNRRLLLDRLNQSIDLSKRHQRILGLIFLDLDKFKSVNDNLGHDVGDELLKAFAVRLNSLLRSDDTFARISGDEFVIILNEISGPRDAGVVAEKIIDIMKKHFLLLGHELQIGCSIGIAIFPDDAANISDLMKNADIAMYAAKAAGRNQYRFYRQ